MSVANVTVIYLIVVEPPVDTNVSLRGFVEETKVSRIHSPDTMNV